MVAPGQSQAEGRYQVGPMLGSGGMGRVLLGHDPVLNRELAVKQALTPASASRLRREAQLLARLDHPSIVAIYDADLAVPWYAMRLVRGSTLTEAIDNCGDLAARLRLLRHVLAAAEGVAHAHLVGIAHRDLKPDNILVSDLGETQVLDWGLAAELDRTESLGAAVTTAADSAVEVDLGEQTRAGSILGTPRYLSPEAARGGHLDRRTDVWSLGVILWQTVTGQIPWQHREVADILACLRAGLSPVPAASAWDGPGAAPPMELLAIARRACAVEPRERYADARALAADLQHWLEGRQVSAYAYSRRELALRAVRTLRLPLAIAAAAVVVVAAVVGGAVSRVLQERDVARAALQGSQRARAALWTGQAVAHARAGAAPEAELAAVAALQFGQVTDAADAAAARGVLAMVGAGPRVALTAEWSQAGCREVAVAEDGGDALCIGDGVASFWPKGAARPLWRVPLAVQSAVLPAANSPGAAYLAVQTGADAVVVLRRDSGAAVGRPVSGGGQRPLTLGQGTVAQPLGAQLAVTVLASAAQTLTSVCETADGVGHLEAVARGPRASWWLVCGDGSVRWLQAGTVQLVARTALRPPLAVATAIHVDAAGVIYLGSSKGHLLRLDASAAKASLQEVPQDLSQASARAAVEAAMARPMASLIREVLAVGGWLALRGDRGEVRLLDAQSLEILASLPGQGHGPMVTGQPQGLVTSGPQLRRWQLPAPSIRSRLAIQDRRSVTSACRLPDGLVVGQGTGDVEKIDPQSGRPLWQARWQPLVVKAVACDASRSTVWTAAMDQPAVIALDGRTGKRSGLWPLPQPVRRLVARGQEGWLAATIVGGLWAGDAAVAGTQRIGNSKHPQLIGASTADWTDLDGGDGSANAITCAVDGSSGQVATVSGLTLQKVALRAGARVCTVVRGGGAIVGLDGQLERHESSGLAWSTQLEGRPADLTGDAEFLAVGLTSGETMILRKMDGKLVARLAGHEERVSAVLFDPSQVALLWTASWDGTLRRWDGGAWRTGADALVAAARRRWGQAAQRALPEDSGDLQK